MYLYKLLIQEQASAPLFIDLLERRFASLNAIITVVPNLQA